MNDREATAARRIAMNPSTVPAPIRGYYSNCVRVSAGSMLFISGQIGTAVKGNVVRDDVALQADHALRSVELVLKANRATMRDVVKVTVYVTDIPYPDAIAPVRLRYFPSSS